MWQPNTPLRSFGLVSKDFQLTESVETAIELSEQQAKALDSLGKELSRSKAWWGSTDSEEHVERRVIELRMRSRGDYLCTIRNAVGVVAVDGIRIFSKPKIPMEHFVYIAKHSFLGDGRTADSETSVADGQSFLDLIAVWLVNSALSVLRQGLSLDYESRTDPIRYATGRIDPVRTSLNLLKGNIEVQSEYQERTPNSPENRILASAIKLISPDLLGTPELSRSFAQLRREFQGIEAVRFADLMLQPRSFPARYRQPVELARALLLHAGISLSAGHRSARSFLVRTPELIEEGIRQILRRELSPVGVRAGGKVLLPTSLRVKPDLLLARPPFTADVKYKKFGSSWDRRDLSQAVFFAESFNSPIAAVLGFSNGHHGLPEVPVGRIRVTPLSWDVSKNSSPQESAQKIARSVLRWLPKFERANLALAG